MTDPVHDLLERLMVDEPPHRPLPDLVRAGERRLQRRRRVGYGAGALAVVGAVGLGSTMLPGGATTAHDSPGVADTVSAAPTTATSDDPGIGQTLAPDAGPAKYTYSLAPACVSPTGCDRYRFESQAVRPPAVAAIEFRLTDGSSKRVPTEHGAYDVVISGAVPPGDRWSADDGLVDATGQPVDLFAGLTLYAADGSVLATATSTESDQLDPYLELCSAQDDPTCGP